MIDFHSHILPEIDDGSNSAEESVLLLKSLKEQGVNKVLLTPHFYAYSSSAEDYKELRRDSVNKLVKALSETPIDIELYLGCEVLYFEELWQIENLNDFCIKGTKYILIEMPFVSWTDTMVRGIEKIIGKGLVPILAHFERYLPYSGNIEKLYQVIDMGVLLQMNCKYVNSFFTRRKALAFIKSGLLILLGTDCHNLSDRAPEYEKAMSYIKKKLSDRRYKRFISIQNRVLQGAQKFYP